MSLTLSMLLKFTATLVGAPNLGSNQFKIPIELQDSLATGTGLDQGDQAWADTRTLAATTSETLDLAASLTNALGQTATFARVKLVYIRLVTTTAGAKIYVGGNATNAWEGWTSVAGSKITVRGDGFIVLYAPDATAYAVTASTGDILKIENPGGASISYQIVVLGASA
jgi:hypothetical protein